MFYIVIPQEKTLFRINLKKTGTPLEKLSYYFPIKKFVMRKKCDPCNHNFGMWAPSHRFSAAFSWLSCSSGSSQTLGGGRHQSFWRFPNNLSTFWFSSKSSPLPSIHSAVLSIRVLSSFLELMNNN